MTITNRFRSLVAAAGVFASVVLPVAAHAATPVFNGQANDYPTLQAAMHGGQWGASVAAHAGDTVSLLVWDHNSVPNSIARNVRIKVNLPSADFRNNHTISASVSADNAATVTGSVAITSTELTKLSFVPGSAKLYANTGGANPTLAQINWPGNVNPDTIVTTSVNLGDQEGCWQYAKAVILQVQLAGQPVENPQGVLSIKKDNRRAGESQYTDRSTVKPGDRVEYRIIAENIDGRGIARNIRLQDFLPAGVTYVAGSGKLTKPNGETMSLSDGVTAGMVILDELRPGQKVTFTSLADTALTFKDAQCVTNRAKVSGENATNAPEDTTDTCFVVHTPTPTPTPPTPTPAPQPELPKTGPEASLLAAAMVSGLGLSTGRYALLKRKVKRQARSLDII